MTRVGPHPREIWNLHHSARSAHLRLYSIVCAVSRGEELPSPDAALSHSELPSAVCLPNARSETSQCGPPATLLCRSLERLRILCFSLPQGPEHNSGHNAETTPSRWVLRLAGTAPSLDLSLNIVGYGRAPCRLDLLEHHPLGDIKAIADGHRIFGLLHPDSHPHIPLVKTRTGFVREVNNRTLWRRAKEIGMIRETSQSRSCEQMLQRPPFHALTFPPAARALSLRASVIPGNPATLRHSPSTLKESRCSISPCAPPPSEVISASPATASSSPVKPLTAWPQIQPRRWTRRGAWPRSSQDRTSRRLVSPPG